MNDAPSYRPDPELALAAAQVSFLFHVLVGADPIGDFQGVENLSYGVQPFSYPEGGRNHSPRLFPFDGPARAGELTLRWGMLVRTQLYDWMRAVQIGQGFRRDVMILQLDRQKVPLRLMRLRNAWPTSWQGATLSSTETGFAVEQLTLVYEDIQLVSNKALLVPGTGQVRADEPTALEASDYQDDQEQLDALLEETEARRDAQRAEEAEIVAAREAAEAERARERLRAEKARERAKADADDASAGFRAGWGGGEAEPEAPAEDEDTAELPLPAPKED